VESPAARSVVAGQSAFAANLYSKLRSPEGNLLFSPYSVHEALSILRPGARGESARALDASLHLPAQDVEAGWTVLHEVVRSDGQATLLVGSRLWLDDRFSIDAGFADGARAVHGVSIVRRSLDDKGSVAREVSAWVKEATAGMIPQAMPPGDVPNDAGIVLANAVYFHGKWQHRFERSATKPRPFTTISGSAIDVPMMTLRETFRYHEDETARTLALAYLGGTTELVLLLPTAETGLEELESSLTADALGRWCTEGSPHEVDLLLPRFRFENRVDLRPVLSDLGLGTLFDRAGADLDGVGTDPRGHLFLSTATHSALIELDEEGTKAAAATVIAGSCSAPVRRQPVEFRCDRPFLFVLRHVPTGAVLFLGRVVAPPRV
jgi:serpin B